MSTIWALGIWFGLLILTAVASAMEAVAASVRELQPQAITTARLSRLEFAGSGLSAVSLALAPLLAFAVLGDFWSAAPFAVLSTLMLLGAQRVARGAARARANRLARLLIGDAAALLPLVEARLEPTEPAEAREETLEQMVDAGEKAGLIESDEREMITGILQLDRTLTRDIMVPRIDVVALEADTPLHDALDLVIAGAHSRVPVYDESIDHVAGLLYAKDLLKALRDGKTDAPVRSLLRPAHFVPESKRLDELLQELQSTKVHMAIVVDEYGGTAGIVTIEDVLEEIVGEIQDEYDTGEEPLIERVNENEGVFNARVNISEVNEALGVNLPSESATLGGLLYQRLEKMPRVGDQLRVDDVLISVLSMVGRRIKKVRVARVPETPADEETLDEEKARSEN